MWPYGRMGGSKKTQQGQENASGLPKIVSTPAEVGPSPKGSPARSDWSHPWTTGGPFDTPIATEKFVTDRGAATQHAIPPPKYNRLLTISAQIPYP